MTFVKVTAIPLSRMRFKNPHLKGYTLLKSWRSFISPGLNCRESAALISVCQTSLWMRNIQLHTQTNTAQFYKSNKKRLFLVRYTGSLIISPSFSQN